VGPRSGRDRAISNRGDRRATGPDQVDDHDPARGQDPGNQGRDRDEVLPVQCAAPVSDGADTAAALPAFFNSDEDSNTSFDTRSDDKGPEPEGIAVGRVDGHTYAFVGLERIGGIVVFDVTLPFLPRFVQYVNTRDFTGDPAAGTAGDLAPEGLAFIGADDSPTGQPLLAAAYEVSGTTRVFGIQRVQR